MWTAFVLPARISTARDWLSQVYFRPVWQNAKGVLKKKGWKRKSERGRPHLVVPLILIVEDDDAVFEAFELAFYKTAPHFQLRWARNHNEVVSMLSEAAGCSYTKPDLILINWKPPKRAGFEILKKLVSARLATSIPAVVLGSSSENTDKAKCVALGARYYTKPNTFEELLSTVQSVCALVQ